MTGASAWVFAQETQQRGEVYHVSVRKNTVCVRPRDQVLELQVLQTITKTATGVVRGKSPPTRTVDTASPFRIPGASSSRSGDTDKPIPMQHGAAAVGNTVVSASRAASTRRADDGRLRPVPFKRDVRIRRLSLGQPPCGNLRPRLQDGRAKKQDDAGRHALCVGSKREFACAFKGGTRKPPLRPTPDFARWSCCRGLRPGRVAGASSTGSPTYRGGLATEALLRRGALLFNMRRSGTYHLYDGLRVEDARW